MQQQHHQAMHGWMLQQVLQHQQEQRALFQRSAPEGDSATAPSGNGTASHWPQVFVPPPSGRHPAVVKQQQSQQPPLLQLPPLLQSVPTANRPASKHMPQLPKPPKGIKSQEKCCNLEPHREAEADEQETERSRSRSETTAAPEASPEATPSAQEDVKETSKEMSREAPKEVPRDMLKDVNGAEELKDALQEDSTKMSKQILQEAAPEEESLKRSRRTSHRNRKPLKPNLRPRWSLRR
ncbi:unnamed protein product [Effrenium voratum]|nr:unnamed protein product [Effrenium voratum]